MAKSKGDAAESKMSKREMVKVAFDTKGDVGPVELQQYIKEQYGTEIPIPMISSYKSQLKKSRGLVKGRKSKPAAAREPAANGRVDLKDVIAVKQLLNRMGHDQLQSVIDALNAE
jgi:hypothetical protein